MHDTTADAVAIRVDTHKPIDNAVVGLWNGRLRDECLNAHLFRSLPDASAKIAAE